MAVKSKLGGVKRIEKKTNLDSRFGEKEVRNEKVECLILDEASCCKGINHSDYFTHRLGPCTNANGGDDESSQSPQKSWT